MPQSGRVVIGVIAGHHGVRGELRLISSLADDHDLDDVKEVVILTAEGQPVTRRLLKARRGNKHWILKLEGFENPEAVEKYRGAELEVDESLLPPTDEGEFYWSDLVGLDVVDTGGQLIGKVVGILPTSAQDLLVVDADGKEALIPAVEPIVTSVDLENGRIVVDPPEGLLD